MSQINYLNSLLAEFFVNLMMIFINPVLDFRRIQSHKQEGAAIWERNIRNCDKWYDQP